METIVYLLDHSIIRNSGVTKYEINNMKLEMQAS